jgi:hypothetical protein
MRIAIAAAAAAATAAAAAAAGRPFLFPDEADGALLTALLMWHRLAPQNHGGRDDRGHNHNADHHAHNDADILIVVGGGGDRRCCRRRRRRSQTQKQAGLCWKAFPFFR